MRDITLVLSLGFILLTLLVTGTSTDMNSCWNQVASHCRAQTLLFGAGIIGGQVFVALKYIVIFHFNADSYFPFPGTDELRKHTACLDGAHLSRDP